MSLWLCLRFDQLPLQCLSRSEEQAVVVNLLLLGALQYLPSSWRRVLDVYGRSPMFFYLAHIWLFMLIGLPFRNGTGYGVLYVVWVIGMVPLYFACKRYTAFKLGKPAESYWRMM